MMKHPKEKCIAKNKNGKIIKVTDFYGNTKYVLLDKDNNYLKEINAPFRIFDYLGKND